MTELIEQWMDASRVKRVTHISAGFGGGWGVYLDNGADTLGTGATIAEALADAESRA